MSLEKCLFSLIELHTQHLNFPFNAKLNYQRYESFSTKVEQNFRGCFLQKQVLLNNCNVNKKLALHEWQILNIKKQRKQLDSLHVNKLWGDQYTNTEDQMHVLQLVKIAIKEALVSVGFDSENLMLQTACEQVSLSLIDIMTRVELPLSHEELSLLQMEDSFIEEALVHSPLIIFSLSTEWQTFERILEGFKDLSKLCDPENVNWALLKALISKYPQMLSQEDFFLGIIPFESYLEIVKDEIPFIDKQTFVESATLKSKDYLKFLNSGYFLNNVNVEGLVRQNPYIILEDDAPNWRPVLEKAYEECESFNEVKKANTNNIIQLAIREKPHLLKFLPSFRKTPAVIRMAILEGYLKGMKCFEFNISVEQIDSLCLDFFIYHFDEVGIDSFAILKEFLMENYPENFPTVILGCLEYIKNKGLSIQDFYAKQNGFCFFDQENQEQYKYQFTVIFRDILPIEDLHLADHVIRKGKQEQTLLKILTLNDEKIKRREGRNRQISLFHDPLILKLTPPEKGNDAYNQLMVSYTNYQKLIARD